MVDPLPSVLSGASLLLAGAAFKFAYSTERRLTSVETKVSLYWGAVEKQMSAMLHSPHRPTLDVLLDKNARDERLSHDEAESLVDLLQKLIDSKELTGNEEAGARMLIAVTIGKYELAI